MGDAKAHCREVLERVFLYIDDEMGAVDCALIRQHLHECADCLKHVDFEVELKRIVRTKCSESVPPAYLVERVRAFFREAT